MDETIFLLLAQDGVTNGAIYTLLALALVMLFAVTRIIFIPQGEFLAYGGLTMAALEAGSLPGTLWVLLGTGALAFAMDLIAARPWSRPGNRQARRPGRGPALGRSAAWNLGYPLALAGLLKALPLAGLPLAAKALLALALVVPLGPMVYRIAFQPVAEAPVLVLLIVAVAVHLAMVGVGLLVFGPEGSRTTLFSEAQLEVGAMQVGGHTLVVMGASVALIAALYLFFDRTLYGKALRATAVNRNGARLMGISPTLAGRLTFLLAAVIGVLSGLLFAPLTTVYYDSGFLIGLKGFVAAIIGGLGSYPLAAGGAVLVGLLESFSSFWTSALKDVLVFTLIIPVLVWRSLASHHVEEEE
ncbi:branched-chain amino acid ABC transporter permease [Azospirillum sp. B506]|uniref:branched-chain amino acid ABC transporter permease n=1 Tax=Azospirillum sp. B506 TaxID=137721 RepID=UPI00034DEDDC|nr:branched-chain amino acid ABC transporter permease [Azospirillum sp. B506]